MGSLVGLLWRPDHNIELASFVLLYIAAVLTFWSMFQYLNAAWNDLLEP
jgi:CDP-diacylglycerol--glycerol-3-phosphate 3-phosphatidyltransferase